MSNKIEIWQLPDIGTRTARNPFNPNDPSYKIIAFLDFMGTATTEQIIGHVLGYFPDLGVGDVSMEIHRLARIGLIQKITLGSQEQGQEQGQGQGSYSTISSANANARV
jgi:hypothetical protein